MLFGVWPASDCPTAFDSVTASYASTANAVVGLLLPAGREWTLARRADTSFPLPGPDGVHPGPMGTVLVVLVVDQGLTGHTLTALPSTLIINEAALGLSPGVTAVLLRTSQEAPHSAWRRGG